MSKQRMRLRAPGNETIWESLALLDKHIKKEKEKRKKRKEGKE